MVSRSLWVLVNSCFIHSKCSICVRLLQIVSFRVKVCVTYIVFLSNEIFSSQSRAQLPYLWESIYYYNPCTDHWSPTPSLNHLGHLTNSIINPCSQDTCTCIKYCRYVMLFVTYNFVCQLCFARSKFKDMWRSYRRKKVKNIFIHGPDTVR